MTVKKAEEIAAELGIERAERLWDIGEGQEALTSKWTHSLCEACYRVLEPGGGPVRLVEAIRDRAIC